MMQKISNSNILLCRNCYNCKKKDGRVYCSVGHFDVDEKNDLPIIFTPYDFDCHEYDCM